MVFFELRKKLKELLEANKKESSILIRDETVLRKNLFEVKREFFELKLQQEKKENLEKEDKSLTEKYNELEQQLFMKTNCNMLEKDDKITQLEKICIPMAETISTLKVTRNKLKKLKIEMAENEFDKKSELLPMWKEIKDVYEVEDLEDEIEIEIYESVASTLDSKDDSDDYDLMFEELRKELEEVKEEPKDSTKKSGFLGKFFSKKND